MRCLSIQFKPECDPRFGVDDLLAHFKALGRFPELDYPDKKRKWVALNFFTDEASGLWREIRENLFTDKELGDWLAGNAIIICETAPESDDYLVLSHFDPDEPVDSL
jgi:hypothetical protein